MKINTNEELLKILSSLQYEFNTYHGFILNSMSCFQHDLESLENSNNVKYVLNEIENIENVLNRYKKLLEDYNDK